MNNTLSPESVVELEKISKEWLNDATLADWNRFISFVARKIERDEKNDCLR